jgi:hypothetical protein
MKIVIYNTKESAYIGENDTMVEGENKAKEFFDKWEAVEWLRETGKVQTPEDEWDYNIIKVIPCRGCGTHEGSDMQYDAYGIETGHWCYPCYESNKYPYRKDRYDYEGAGERLEEEW